MTTSQQDYVNGKFLLAMPGLNGSCFSNALIYMLEHNDDGAVGLIVNHPIQFTVDEVLQQVVPDYHQHLHTQTVYSGGPVASERGFILHRPMDQHWDSQIRLSEKLAVTTSPDILQALANGETIGDFLFILGYSGWSSGQLEQELAENAWLTLNADEELLFNTPTEQRIAQASKHLGFDHRLLSSEAGHA